MAHSLAIDPAGDLILADLGSGRIRVVAERTGTRYGQHMKAGDIYTVAGGGASQANGAPALKSKLVNPCAVAVDSRGNIAFAVGAGRRVRAVAAATGRFYGQQMAAGHIYVIAGNGGTWLSGDGGPAAKARMFPSAEVTDSSGNVIFADAAQRVYRSEIRILVRRAGTYFGRRMTAGNVYALVGSGPEGFSGDGGPGTRARLSISIPIAAVSELALDRAGNLVFLDTGNYRVRVLAASAGTFYGKKMKAGYICHIAGKFIGGTRGDGGPAIDASMFPNALAYDARGNLLIADTLLSEIRVVAVRTGTFYGQSMTAGHIYGIAGDGHPGYSGDGGPATSAEISAPQDAAAAAAGLFIADSANLRFRLVT